MIDFTRSFDTAWERMNVILFRPFDFGKWCVVGFSAFLAGLLTGGNGVNFSFNQNSFTNKWQANYNFSTNTTTTTPFSSSGPANVFQMFSGMETGLIILIAAILFAFVLALIVAMYWLGARGQFLILDNIVRNRGVISEPWRRYAGLGDQLFVFFLIFLAVAFTLILPIMLVALLVCWPLFLHPRWPTGGETSVLVLLSLIYLVIAIPVGVVFFLFREWGVPLMFRQQIGPRAAFQEILSLIRLHPGTAVVFVLLRIVLWVALAIVSVIACCFTCCLGLLPYVGTVVLLPALIYIRCFSLDCLAQLGPRYDVWAVDVPETASSVPLPVSLPPPLE